MESLSEIYSKIKQNLNHEHLKKISIDILHMYKNSEFHTLRRYIPIINAESTIQISKLFSCALSAYSGSRLEAKSSTKIFTIQGKA